jgi:hypothetical protein
LPELAGRDRVAEKTIYRWNAKLSGVEVSDARS